MQLKNIWEYNICYEYYDEYKHQQIYECYSIISEESPVTAWSRIFSLLSKETNFEKITKFGKMIGGQRKKVLLMRMKCLNILRKNHQVAIQRKCFLMKR